MNLISKFDLFSIEFMTKYHYKILFKNDTAHDIFGKELIGKDCYKVIKGQVKKMEKQIQKNPNLKKIINGLQVAVKGIKDPLIEGELDKCKEFNEVYILFNSMFPNQKIIIS